MLTSSAPSPSGFPSSIRRWPTAPGSFFSLFGTRFRGMSTQMSAASSSRLRFEKSMVQRKTLPVFIHERAVRRTAALSCSRPFNTGALVACSGNPDLSRSLPSTSLRCTG